MFSSPYLKWTTSLEACIFCLCFCFQSCKFSPFPSTFSSSIGFHSSLTLVVSRILAVKAVGGMSACCASPFGVCIVHSTVIYALRDTVSLRMTLFKQFWKGEGSIRITLDHSSYRNPLRVTGWVILVTNKTNLLGYGNDEHLTPILDDLSVSFCVHLYEREELNHLWPPLPLFIERPSVKTAWKQGYYAWRRNSVSLALKFALFAEMLPWLLCFLGHSLSSTLNGLARLLSPFGQHYSPTDQCQA